MKAYDVTVDLHLVAVVRATSEAEAEGIARTLADNFSERSQMIDGSAYQVASVSEFSVNYDRECSADVDEAYDMNDLAEAAEGDTCTACERDSLDCSRAPCAAVVADRVA